MFAKEKFVAQRTAKERFAKDVFAHSTWGWVDSAWPSFVVDEVQPSRSFAQFQPPTMTAHHRSSSHAHHIPVHRAQQHHKGQGLDVAQSLARMWDEVDYGALLLSPKAQLLYANHVARYELANGMALRLTPDGVCAQDAEHDHRWMSGLAAASLGERCMLTVGDGLILSLSPLRGSPYDDDGEGPPRVIAIMGKRKPVEELSLRMFARMLHLTPAETTVLIAACEGHNAAELAERLSVQESTINTHLKQLRHKAGVRTMRELMLKVAGLPPIVPAVKTLV
jgi:DNA-binding CsgD family transcriptional regulator